MSKPRASRPREGASRRFLREPLLHFLLIGAAIFGLYGVAAERSALNADGRIVVAAGEVERLRELWAWQRQRSPTADELRALVDGHVREEVLYREALRMGLDQGDSIIRRRLAQKLEFLMEDLAAARKPTNAELATFFALHSDRYRIPGRVSFSQIFFSPDRRGPAAEQDARLLLAGLRSDAPPDESADLGDSFMMAGSYHQQSADEVESLFGHEVAEALFQLEPDSWQGPVLSGYGWHLVRIDERSEARLPALAEVVEWVRSDWSYEQRRQANMAVFERLRARYEIAIDDGAPGEVGLANWPGPERRP